jgi:hypothetical protein
LPAGCITSHPFDVVGADSVVHFEATNTNFVVAGVTVLNGADSVFASARRCEQEGGATWQP